MVVTGVSSVVFRGSTVGEMETGAVVEGAALGSERGGVGVVMVVELVGVAEVLVLALLLSGRELGLAGAPLPPLVLRIPFVSSPPSRRDSRIPATTMKARSTAMATPMAMCNLRMRRGRELALASSSSWPRLAVLQVGVPINAFGCISDILHRDST